MQLQEAVEIIQGLFERYGFTIEHEADYDDLGGQWTLLFGPNDENAVKIAEALKAYDSALAQFLQQAIQHHDILIEHQINWEDDDTETN